MRHYNIAPSIKKVTINHEITDDNVTELVEASGLPKLIRISEFGNILPNTLITLPYTTIGKYHTDKITFNVHYMSDVKLRKLSSIVLRNARMIEKLKNNLIKVSEIMVRHSLPIFCASRLSVYQVEHGYMFRWLDQTSFWICDFKIEDADNFSFDELRQLEDNSARLLMLVKFHESRIMSK